MRVRAIEPGYFNGLRVPDTDSAEFEVPDGTQGSWFKPDNAPAKAAKSKPKKSEGDKKPEGDGGADLV